ncbi:MAG: LysR family transcriptional regulator [Deltaproteobacteria bacterium]|nr:LysR family transcriptional regulator [Deltaproteobacteria bacterium]
MPRASRPRLPLPALHAFVTLADLIAGGGGGFSATANQLGLTKATISKRIAELEATLGARLLHRTTRSVRLSEAGEAFYQRCAKILEAVEEAQAEVGALSGQVIGRLRFSTPVSLGQAYLLAPVTAFAAANPKLELDWDLDDRMVDVVTDGYDVAIRVGQLPDSSLVARKLFDSRFVVVASPAYLKAHGTPRVPADLERHECLRYRYQQAPDVWAFSGPKPVSVRVKGRFRANHGDVLKEAAVAGLGIAMLPDFVVFTAVKAGLLQVVLDRNCRSTIPVSAVFPSSGARAAKVDTFVHMLAKDCKPVSLPIARLR